VRRFDLDLQADRIEAVLASHRAPARVTGGIVTPRLIRFLLAPLPGVRLRRLAGLAEEVALALAVQACRISRGNGALALEVPRPDPTPVALLPLCATLARIPPYTALIGLDEQGTPLLLSLASPDVAHALIAGSTGSGKTVLLRAIVASLAANNHPRQIQFILVDPKGHGLAPFSGLPHLLCPVVADPDQTSARLDWLVEEMLRRDREGITAPRLVLVVDELAEVITTGGNAIEALTRLTQRGREAGIHVVASTQKPTAALLGPLLKVNFPVRLIGSVPSADDARTAAGFAGTQAERLLGRGDFVLVYRGQCCRFQAAHIRPDELCSLVAQFYADPRASRRRLLWGSAGSRVDNLWHGQTRRR
jgi:S-DNA-T family DNA segregation ATPase FtsK/SpoIIIE